MILALLTVPSLAAALTIHNPTWAQPRTSPEALFSRDSTCGDDTYVQCAADLPSDFCCPATSTCMALAGKTTALCCPTGLDCSQILPIPCDLSLEDKTKYPSATVMTSALTGTLETCGSKCCPFGYTCSGDDVCNLKSDQSAKPETSSVVSSTTASSTQSSTGTQTAAVNPTTASESSPSTTSSSADATSSSDSSTASSAADSTSSASSAATGSASSGHDGTTTSNAGLVAGGVIGGVAGLVFLGLIVLFLVKRERKRKALAQNGGADGGDGPRSSSSFGNILHHPVTRGSPAHPEISKPIVSETGTWRSDFTRKVSTRTPGSWQSSVAGDGDDDNDDDNDDDDDVDEEVNYNDHGDDHHDGMMYGERLDDEVASMREVPRSPPRIIDPNGNSRAVSSMYGSFYDPNDPVRRSEYQGPLKMPSARAYGGDDTHVSVGPGRDWLGDPLSSYYGGGGGGGGGGGESRARSQETDAAYIDVFADSNALAPPPLGFGERERRETRFSDFRRGP
ncbi:unnamed protein product [Discula destructiva]